VKSIIKSMLIISFGVKGIVKKEFVLAGQTVNSAYYCDVLRRRRENVRRLLPEIWRERNWLYDFRPLSSLIFSVSPCEDKTERSPFWHSWGGGSEYPQTTQLPGCIKKWQKRWERCIRAESTTSRVMVASRPEVSFWPDGSTSPGNYWWLFVASQNQIAVLSWATGTAAALWKLRKTALSFINHWETSNTLSRRYEPHGTPNRRCQRIPGTFWLPLVCVNVCVCMHIYYLLRGLSPQANYTGRATPLGSEVSTNFCG
jgi:hypothetical protein